MDRQIDRQIEIENRMHAQNAVMVFCAGVTRP